MKKGLQAILQRLLGFERYLFLFAWFKVYTFRFDKKERDFFGMLDELPEDACVLDIGANLGFTTVLLAKHCKKGKVIAFEPIPENFRTLQKMIRHFRLSNVIPMNLALGTDSGELEMVMPQNENVKMQGLSHVLREGENPPPGARYTVPVKRLDSLPELAGLKLSGIKIDVEEFEYPVLLGGASLIRQSMPLIYAELWDSPNRKKVFSLLSEMGYSVFVRMGEKKIPFEPGMQKQNFFFRKA